ncbi:hypothetical protein V6N12_057343 [Hibiscus sabdariffa]|uniref:Uncharacterized protein n=1 Tax=Hibiscus sabdariffa TaxID=183260 RepID=A0ABR2DBX5_9ROSI
MLSQTRCRQPRKEFNSPKGITSSASHSGGSRFFILEEVNGDERNTTGVVAGDIGVENTTIIESSPTVQMPSAAVPIRHEQVGCRKAPARGVLREVEVVAPNRVQVVAPGETQVPRVDTHVVHNVVGNHSAISILDAANEKRRQKVAINSGKHIASRKSIGEGLKAGLKL